jgi:PBP1b-binding outer membrane lipoprotein LpoB
MTDKKTLLLAVLVLLSGCASEEKQPAKNPQYSSTTQKEFEKIEKGEVQKASLPPAHDIQRQQNKKTTKDTPKEKKEAVELSPETELSSKGQERLQEINQNLAFYCMKHRTDGAFSNEDQCTKFTKKILIECEKKHKLINTVMVNCIKDRLKKRR